MSIYDDEIDVRDISRTLWSGKWLIAAVIFVTALVAVVVAFKMPNIYRTEALLAVNEQDNAGRFSSVASQYGGLASLAGINLNGGSIDKIEVGLATLKSRRFLSAFIARHDILVPLMAADGWDAETGKLIIDRDTFDPTTMEWTRSVRPPKTPTPSAQEAYEAFVDILSISRDRSSGFVTVAITHVSPTIAKQWVDWLIQDLNSSIMREDVEEAERAIKYLNDQIENTSLAQLQSVFFNLIEEQKKIMMLAAVSPEYMFKTIDPPVVPERKARPNRAMIVAVGALFGLVLGASIAIFRSGGRGP